jgi:serine/threonine protein kinase
MFKRSDFQKLVLLGGGKKNTKIFKVEHTKTKKQYVLKEVEARNLEKLNEYKEEAVQLSKVQNHPNILQFYGYYFYETPNSTYKLGIICEFIKEEYNLELVYRLREEKRMYWKEEEILKIIFSLIDALAFLQSIGICHRDIKPSNLFLLNNGELKVIDFGESKENTFNEEDGDHMMATIRGTPQYLSPVLWRAHNYTPSKLVEHDTYKSDVFSVGLVIFQLAALKDVNGFNQKNQKYDGERLIIEGLEYLSQIYSQKVIEIIRMMLIFNEEKRPNFLELSKYLFGESYFPRIDRSLQDFSKDNRKNLNVSSQTKKKTNDEKLLLFKSYVDSNGLKFNTNNITYWFEYGGNMIAKYYLNKEANKWKLIGKYKSEFPGHFQIIFIDEDIGHFLVGGVDNNNTFQYRDGQIVKKSSMNVDRSFMMVVLVNNTLLAIGGYENLEKNQLASIECYDFQKDIWYLNEYEDLKMARSQGNALVLNSNYVLVFGGYNKNFGTLTSFEKINVNKKTSEILEIKLPKPLRRFGSLKVAMDKILIFGGITRLCKESDSVYCLDIQKYIFSELANLPKSGVIEHEVLIDEIGQVHLFYENNYGTSPPQHFIYNYLDFNC